MDMETCLAEGYLQKVNPSKGIQKKEISSAEYDLKRAEASFDESDYKWSTIQSYYCIFHAARALLNSIGYREKRHFAIGVVLESFAKSGKISAGIVSDFAAAMSSREDADYRDVYSQETAKYMLEVAEDFLKEAKNILKINGAK
jgi:uncharacterized protein (UPF0332 family)